MHRLSSLDRELGALIDETAPDVACLESLFGGKNVRSLIVLAQARGVILCALARRGLEVVEYAPAEIKAALTGNGRAPKDQVERMVRLVLGLASERLSADASDALATAVCAAQRRPIDRLRSAGATVPATPARGGGRGPSEGTNL